MLRATLSRHVKLLIVESPNKVSNVSHYVAKIPDLTFGDGALASAFGATPREPVHVMATVGHFQKLDEINIEQVADVTAPASGDATADDAAAAFRSGADAYRFETTYRVDKAERAAAIRQYIEAHVDELTEVIIATDPDREGEIIGEHALQLAQATVAKSKGIKVTGKKKNAGPVVPYSRAYMQSITEDGVAKALRERTPNQYDEKLASAAMARSVLDRVFGYFGSAMVQTLHAKLKSIGRVQTPALILIHDREVAHDEFLRTRATTYGLTARADVGDVKHGAIETACAVTIALPASSATAAAAAPQADTTAAAAKKKGRPKKGKDTDVEAAATAGASDDAAAGSTAGAAWSPTTLDDAKALAAKLVDASSQLPWTASVSKKAASRSTEPPQPLTLQALMLRMGRKSRMGSEEVMKICQQLFSDGLITYPRTDSVRIETAPADVIKAYVKKTYGANSLATDAEIAERLSGERVKGKRGKKSSEPSNAEDAHEALRPTNIAEDGSMNPILRSCDRSTLSVYEEIRAVALAAFMTPHTQETLSCTFTAPLDAVKGLTTGDTGASTAPPLPPPGSTISCRVFATRTASPGFTQAFGHSAGEGENSADLSTGGEPSEDALFAYLRDCAKSSAAAPAFALKSFKAVERKAAPPPLYFEGALIEDLKQQGIGRPSTYATILATLKSRDYVSVDGATGRIRTTPHGRELVVVSRRFFPLFVDLKFTSRMEGSLDAIVRGVESPNTLLSSVHTQLLAAATEVARASYFKDADERKANAQKAQLVVNRVPQFAVQTVNGGKLSADEYCSRVRTFLRRHMKPGTTQ
jgi:DNA topoisomerase IA